MQTDFGYHIGIDPGTSKTAIAGVDSLGNLRFIKVIKNTDGKGQAGAANMILQINEDFCGEDVVLPGCYEGDHPVLSWGVEAQEIYQGAKGRKTENPRSLLLLALVAGSLLSAVLLFWPDAMMFFPKPSDWKKQQTKYANQKISLESLGFEVERAGGGKTAYARPTEESLQKMCESGQFFVFGSEGLLPGDWKDIGDAIGIALYCKKKYETKRVREAALSES